MGLVDCTTSMGSLKEGEYYFESFKDWGTVSEEHFISKVGSSTKRRPSKSVVRFLTVWWTLVGHFKITTLYAVRKSVLDTSVCVFWNWNFPRRP
jgi:hypothetical protein